MGKVREFETEKDIPHHLLGQMKFLNRGSVLGFFAAREAVSLSGMKICGHPSRPKGPATLLPGMRPRSVIDFMYPAVKEGTHGRWQEMDFEALNRSTVDKVNPFFLLESICNNLFSFLSASYEFMGPNTTLAMPFPLWRECAGTGLQEHPGREGGHWPRSGMRELDHRDPSL